MCKEFAPVSTILVFDGVSGWPDGVAWVMSVGNAMYAFASLDAITHVAEEMEHPGKEIPRVMLVHSIPFLNEYIEDFVSKLPNMLTCSLPET